MQNLISCLYDTFGAEVDPDEPVWVVNEDIAIYFEYENTGKIAMTCPMPDIPHDPELLKDLQYRDNVWPVQLSTSDEIRCAVATYWISQSQTDDAILSSVTLMIKAIVTIQKYLGLIPDEEYF